MQRLEEADRYLSETAGAGTAGLKEFSLRRWDEA